MIHDISTELFKDMEEDVPYVAPQLHGTREPGVHIQKEKPVHRLMAYMRCMGSTQAQIAESTGYTKEGVGIICRQTWFRELCAQLIHNEFHNDIGNLLKGAAVDSFFTVVELRDNAKSEAVRLQASNSLLDRHLGKAAQSVKISDGDRGMKNPAEEIQDLRLELSSLKERQKGVTV